jgi:hypothetical protein
MRFIVCVLAILAQWVSSASAQTAALIGLRVESYDDDHSRHHPPSYRTLLIAFRDGKAHLVADIPDLIVPRKDGFWRVGILHKKEDLTESYQEFVYAAPVLSIPHAVGEYDLAGVPGQTCSWTDDASITFVSPTLMSVLYSHGPDCRGLFSSTQHATHKLDDSGGAHLDIQDVLGPAAWVALKKAAPHKRACVEGDEDFDPIFAGVGPEDRKEGKPSSIDWGIARAAGGWRVFSDVWDTSCRGDDTFEIKYQLASSVTGGDYHGSTLSSLSRTKSPGRYSADGEDAVLTPAGDFLVTLGDGAAPHAEGFVTAYGPIEVFPVNGESLGAASVLSVALTSDFSVVMLQWSVGKYVAHWESDLKAIAAKGLPKPTVVIAKTHE